jgi:putative lipoic acid-binding regulatory protein
MHKQNLESLRTQLLKQTWPNVYLYKFIISNNNSTHALISALFHEGSDIRYKSSAKGNFMSVTASEVAFSVDEIIEKYLKASEIPGVIAL